MAMTDSRGKPLREKNDHLRVAFLLRILAPYRVPLYQRLNAMPGLDIRIFCQNVSLNSGHRPSAQWAAETGLPLVMLDTPDWHLKVWDKTRIPLPVGGLSRALKAFIPDVIVMEGMSNIGNDLLCLSYVLKRRIPFVWWSLGNIPTESHTLRARAGVPIQRWFVKHASAMLAYSSFAKSYMESLGGKPEDIFVVYNTLDEKELLAQAEHWRPRTDELRDELQLGDGPVVIFAGTINPGKQLDLLIDAFAQTRKRLTSANPNLVVIGDGPALHNCVEQATRLGVTEHTHFVGRKEEDASAYFQLGDVCVLPGLGGLSINHAFAHGIPVICGRADGCEEDLVFTGQTGIRLDRVTRETLADAMTSLLSDIPRTRRMGSDAKTLVTEKITMNNYAATVSEATHYAYGQAHAG